MRMVFLLVITTYCVHVSAQPRRWNLSSDGGISWKLNNNDPHTDHIEMSGKAISAIVTYGIDSMAQLVLKEKLIFPMLRIIPNNTRGSLSITQDENIVDSIKADGHFLRETPTAFHINGYLQTESSTNSAIKVERWVYPSVDKAACVEKYVLLNTGAAPVMLQIPGENKNQVTDSTKGVYGSYVINRTTYYSGTVQLLPGEKCGFSLVISGRKKTEDPYHFSADYELKRRQDFISGLMQTLVLKTPNDTLNRMFAFAKIRAAESIFDTKEGLMHSPGGGEYYAAIWANDQAEYVSPFFPFLGNVAGNESARNCYRLFGRYMNADYKPIPSSIIAEGADTWNGAGDRGDQAMIAYGASRFALAYADTIEAKRLWPLIQWCLGYLRRQQTAQGVIVSQSDELEGRFPAGKINLSTNVLTYGAYVNASRLATALGKTGSADSLRGDALELKANIGKYFGATVQGFDTYRYYDGNNTLRSWICLPLVMGIFDRKENTIKALLSKYLWTKDGILTESGSATFWDRATLYTFRGLFYAGATDTSIKYFDYYSSMRLLGEHVPYAVEAWPEGDQRHLSAESGLYCRVITEGLFGIDPTGFHSFTMTPRLPAGWTGMSLDHIRAFDRDFDIAVHAAGQDERIVITSGGKTVKEILWNKRSPITVTL